MRRLLAVALVVTVMAVPAFAQHGGGAHGGGSAGFHGGLGGRPAFASHGVPGGASQAGRARYAGGPVARAGGGSAVQGDGQAGHTNAPGSFSGSRPVFYTRGRGVRPYGPRRSGGAYAYREFLGNGYVGDGYLDYGLLDNDDPDDGGYNDDSVNGAADDGGPQGQGYDAGPQGSYDQGTEAPAQEPAAGMTSRVGVASHAGAQAVAPGLYDSDAVTLVFKDGRPVEKIHNYALTRTTLYVTDAHRQEIPVAALDLEATEKANREAGVSFQLPVAGR